MNSLWVIGIQVPLFIFTLICLSLIGYSIWHLIKTALSVGGEDE